MCQKTHCSDKTRYSILKTLRNSVRKLSCYLNVFANKCNYEIVTLQYTLLRQPIFSNYLFLCMNLKQTLPRHVCIQQIDDYYL